MDGVIGQKVMGQCWKLHRSRGCDCVVSCSGRQAHHRRGDQLEVSRGHGGVRGRAGKV